MKGIWRLLLLISLLGGCLRHYTVPESATVNIEYALKEAMKAAPKKQLGVKEVLKLALRGNLDYQILRARVSEAKALVKQADAGFYPKVVAGVRYVQADSPLMFLSTKLDQHRFQFVPNFNQVNSFGSGRGYVSLRYGLNLGGAQVFQSLLARVEREIRKKERTKVLNGLVTALIEGYYNVLLAKKGIQIARDAVKTISSQLQETKARQQAGSALKTDVLSLEVRLAAAKEEVIRAENRYELLKNALTILMGLGPLAEIELKEENWEPRKLPKTYREGIQVALKNRPELQIAKARYTQARYGQRLAQSMYFPNLELFADYYFEDRDLRYTTKRDNWIVGAGVSMNLFDGFQIYGKIKEALAKKRAAKLAFRKVLLGIQHEVEAAYLSWKEARERVKVLKLALKQAEENFRLVKKQYENGAATITKYLSTELALQKTRFQLTEAEYDLKKAKAKVGHALGLCAQCVQ